MKNYRLVQYRRYHDALVSEFFWQLENIMDVLRGRAQHQQKFKEATLSSAFSLLQNAGTIGSVVSSAGSVVLGFLGQYQENKKVQVLSPEQLSGKWDALRDLVDTVAGMAVGRYRHFLANSTESDAVELGRVSAQRIWEYIPREKLTLTISTMLTGILKGRSGRWEDDWRNTGLTASAENKRQTAEGALKHSGIAYCNNDGQWHYALPPQDKGKSSPKYGFMQLPESLAKERIAEKKYTIFVPSYEQLGVLEAQWSLALTEITDNNAVEVSSLASFSPAESLRLQQLESDWLSFGEWRGTVEKRLDELNVQTQKNRVALIEVKERVITVESDVASTQTNLLLVEQTVTAQSNQLKEHHAQLGALQTDLTRLQARFILSTNTAWTRFSYIPNQNFQRRQSLWRALEERFSEKHPTFPLVLSGQGGMGKSSLASQWAHKQEVHEQYQAVRFMLMDKVNIMNSLYDLAKDLHITTYEYDAITQEKKPRKIEAWLRDISQIIKKQSWFMVWDNVENYAAIEPLLPYFIHTTALHQHLLITSRDSTSWARPIYVDTYTRDESLQYIKNQMDQVALTNFNEQHAYALAERLEDNPLALELAMGAVCLHRHTLHRYLQQLETAGTTALHITPKKAYQARINLNTITTLWHMELEYLTSDAIALLRLMSFINGEGVRRALLVNFLENDESRCDAALLALRAQSFIQPQAHPSLEKWRMHRLLQDVVRADFLCIDDSNNKIILNFLHKGATVLKNTFFIEEHQMDEEGVNEGITHGTTWSHYQNEFVINIESSVSQSVDRINCEMSFLLWKAEMKSLIMTGVATNVRMRFETLSKQYKETKAEATDLLISSRAFIASSRDFLASFPGERAKQPLTPGPTQSASAANLESRSAIEATALGKQSLKAKNYANARDCFTQALTVYRAIYGQEANHQDIATALKNLGEVYQAVKHPIYACDYLTQALVMYRSVYGQAANHHDIAETLILLGAACESSSFFKARAYYKDALTMLDVLKCANDHSLVIAAQQHLDSTTHVLCCVACCCPCVCTGATLYVLINTLFQCCSGTCKPAPSEATTINESNNPLTKELIDSSATELQISRSSELVASPRKQNQMDRLPSNQIPLFNEILSETLKQKIHTLFRQGYNFSTQTTHISDKQDELSIQATSLLTLANRHDVDFLAEVEQEYIQIITDSPSQPVVENQGNHRWIVRSSPYFIANMSQELRTVVSQYAEKEEKMKESPCITS